MLKRYIEEQPTARDHINGLLQYSDARYGQDFKEVKALFARDLVSQEHILKLYRPNEIVVTEIHGRSTAVVVHDWPQLVQRNWTTINCWTFQTDGSGFARKLTVQSIPPIESNFQEISSPVAYPIRFANPELQEKIRANRWKQWRFRTVTQVMYKAWNVNRDQYYVIKECKEQSNDLC